jgi:hypothetical protein
MWNNEDLDGYEMLKKVMNEHPETDAIFARLQI